MANGETVYSIARKFKVDPSAIINSNNLNKNSQLKAGDKLTIPQN